MQNTDATARTRGAVATAVRVEMARAGMNQSQLAAAIGQQQPWVSRRLASDAKTPFSIDDLVRISAVLGCPITALLPLERAA